MVIVFIHAERGEAWRIARCFGRLGLPQHDRSDECLVPLGAEVNGIEAQAAGSSARQKMWWAGRKVA